MNARTARLLPIGSSLPASTGLAPHVGGFSAAPQRLNPAQEAAVDRWKAFVEAMEESGL